MDELRAVFSATESPWGDSRRVSAVIKPISSPPDVAVLTLAQEAPANAQAVKLHQTPGRDLSGRSWWAYGLEGTKDTTGGAAHGIFGEPLKYGQIRLNMDGQSRTKIVPGFSGAGVWSEHYQAVVAIVVAGKTGQFEGDGRALLLSSAAKALPDLSPINGLSEPISTPLARPGDTAKLTPDTTPRRRLRVAYGKRSLAPTVLAGGLMLDANAPNESAILVSPDGKLLVQRAERVLHVARVNRASAVTAAWNAEVPLHTLPDGEVLAVSSAGREDLTIVWASASGTSLLIARPAGGAPAILATLSDATASAAVVIGSQALLALRRQDGTVECRAFAGIHVASMVAARSGGETLVLAQGTSRISGEAVATIELNGRARQQLENSDVFLELPLAWRQRPRLVDADGRAIDLSPEPQRYAPYSHWTDPSMHVATRA